MAQRWQHGSPSSAAQPALASGGAPQPSCLPGSAEQPADESYPRVWDGKLYTRAEFHEHVGWYLPGSAEQPAANAKISETTAAAVRALQDAEAAPAPWLAAATMAARGQSSSDCMQWLNGSTRRLVGNDDAYFCSDCMQWLNGSTQWLDHLAGKRHWKVMTRLTLGNDDPDDVVHVRYCVCQEFREAVRKHLEIQ